VIALCKSANLPAPVHENILHYLWVQYAITGGLWPALVRAGSLKEVLDNSETGKQGLRAVKECLEVVARRGVDLKKYPETRMYQNTSAAAMWIANLAIKFMFRFNKLVIRSSLHALDDAEEIQTFYYDLLNMGRQLGVEMPAMNSFEPDIQKFAALKSGSAE
jgi:ketopantoate reductase